MEVCCEEEGAAQSTGSMGGMGRYLVYYVRRRNAAHGEAATLPCSLARACSRSTGPRYPRTRGTDGAAQLQRSCSCSVLGRGTQNGDCLGL